MAFAQVSNPRCAIDIYPFEGGPYSISSDNGNIMSLSTHKNIAENEGTFVLTLAPGGPNGTEQAPSWSEVITPMSFVVIAMQRGTEFAITMLGVVTNISESQAWTPEGPVVRTITVTGKDFGYFFSMFGYYSLYYLGAYGAAFPAATPGVPQSGGLPSELSSALVQGPPNEVAQNWFNQIMAGNEGILSRTYVPYQGSEVNFTAAMGSFFEPYAGSVQIPYGESFISYEGPWTEKFREILPSPWYEFFIGTAPNGFYNPAGLNSNTDGYAFTSSLLGPSVTASPILVARLTPFPNLTNSSTDPNGSAPFDGIDVGAWNQLPIFQPDSSDPPNLYPFINSTVGFSEAEVINLYIINPTWFRALFGGATGGGNTNLSPLFVNFSSGGDIASIHKYGFRIGNGTISWFADITGDISESKNTNLAALLPSIIARFASFYEPLPLMASSSVAMPLRPDILPGCRFRHQPFKNQPSWDFYIQSVDQSWVFGGPSMTTLGLIRGFPTSVYADSSTASTAGAAQGVLFNSLKGNAQRVNGNYVVGVPAFLGPTFQSLAPTAMAQWLSQITPLYTSPQAVSGTAP